MSDDFKPDASGAYINPAELNKIAQEAPGISPPAREALRRAALEITRQRNCIDHWESRAGSV